MTTFIYTKDTGYPQFNEKINVMEKQPKIEMPLNWMEIELYKTILAQLDF